MGLFTFLSTSSLLPSSLVSQLSWVPMVCVILAYSGYGLGYSVIPGILSAEIMPVEIRYLESFQSYFCLEFGCCRHYDCLLFRVHLILYEIMIYY